MKLAVLSLLTILTSLWVTSCAETRPALTPAGLPDPSRRMSLKGWYLDPSRPKEAAVLTFAYPAETTMFQTKTLEVGHSLYQYRLESIKQGFFPQIFPQLTVTDLDTGKQMVLNMDHEVNGVHAFSEEPVAPPYPVPPAQ